MSFSFLNTFHTERYRISSQVSQSLAPGSVMGHAFFLLTWSDCYFAAQLRRRYVDSAHHLMLYLMRMGP